MLRVLLVDDQPDSVQPAVDELRRHLSAECEVVSTFERARARIVDFGPNIIILDIVRGTLPEGSPEGMDIYHFIWKDRFCPLIVYSAFAQDFAGEVAEHPFVKVVSKGSGSEAEVVKQAQSFGEHIEALRQVECEMDQAINLALRYVAPHAFDAVDDVGTRSEFLIRAVRRRVAGMMDAQLGVRGLACWEQYLFPPCHKDLLLGDILRKRDGSGDNPRAFRVVLTPSCDMVRTDGRKPNVKQVLVARCADAGPLLKKLQLARNTEKGKLQDRLLPALRQGYHSGCIPLPALPCAIPTMTADVRDLELIDIDQINDDDGAYKRVASVDSPFRELIAWAYVQTSGRPGLPERDFDAWCEEIIEASRQGEKREG